MTNNIKLKQRGFTLVELLIVIVVIAILAAISIVAYNGIQNRSKSSAGQSVAASVVKKIEALNSIKGTYFTAGGQSGAAINTLANAAPTAKEALLDQPSTVLAATDASTSGLTASTADNGKAVAVYGCPGGANVWYWDFAAATPAQVATPLKAGAGC